MLLRYSNARMLTPPNEADPGGLGKSQHEAGDDEQPEAHHERRVLPPLDGGHADVERPAGGRFHDLAAPDFQLMSRLLEKVESVVGEHPADDAEDEKNVEEPDPVDQRLIRLRRGEMNASRSETRVRPRMTAGRAARGREVAHARASGDSGTGGCRGTRGSSRSSRR